MRGRSPGRFEFELLQFVKEKGPLSVRHIQQGFGEPKGYVRGTIVKSVDRLLKKGLVARDLVDGVYLYRVPDHVSVSEQSLIDSFVKERLRGRISPLLAYFVESERVTQDQIDELKQVLERFEQGEVGGSGDPT